ncbi:MAG: sensor histidine kinase, partial [Planctomycetota bacterium]
LTLADADAGQLIRDREPCDLRVIVEKTIAMLAPLAKVRLVDVRPSVGPAMVDGDPLRLAQLVENLPSNAIRYNRKGGSVEVSVCADQDVVKLTISDTGLGIPRECLPHVFQRFYRADQGRARSDGGAGLGLAICEEIVRAHDGTVRIDSEPGLGTVVQVELPGSERRPHGTN